MDVEKATALLQAIKDLGYEVVEFSDHYDDGNRDVSIMLMYPDSGK
jgi:hypothetical protein